MLDYIFVFVAGLFYGWLFCYLKCVFDKQLEVDLLKTENNRLQDKLKECKDNLIKLQIRLRGE